jgi:hypothetical protein
VLGAALAGILALGFLLWRGERERTAERGLAPEAPNSPASVLDAAEASPGSPRVPAKPEPHRPKSLRGRVLTADGAPLAGCAASLSFVDRHLARTRTDEEGRFEFAGPVREGTVLTLFAPDDWNVEPEEIELDALPEEELAFVARLIESEEVTAPVRGVMVDEVDGTPIPYLMLHVASESLETDAEGRFATTKRHPKGQLEIGSTWIVDVDFDPESLEPLRVPGRVGPAIYVDIRGEAEELRGEWSAVPSPSNAQAFAVQGAVRCMLRRQSPALVRLPGHERPLESGGEILLYSVPERVVGRGLFSSGCGALAAPLPIELRSCAYLGVRLQLSRDLGWYEGLEIGLNSVEGGRLASCQVDTRSSFLYVTFAVMEAGDYLVEARFEGDVLAQAAVKLGLKDSQEVRLDVPLPEDDEAENGPEVERAPVSGRVTSARNRPAGGQIRLTRASDGEESSLPLEWTKTQGRWEATFAGEAPAGELRVTLEMKPCFGYSGPRQLTLPRAEELVYALDDAVPLVDVYVVPVAAEDGAPLLSYYGELHLDDGNIVGGEDFGSPSVPIAIGHPCNVPFTWLCTSGGRGAASGRYEGRSEGGEVHIPVPLARGWGAFLYVGDPNYQPIEGAEVFLDGVRHGATGLDGHAALAGSRPSSITIRYRDWRIVDGEVEPSGAFDDSSLNLRAYLAPPTR